MLFVKAEDLKTGMRLARPIYNRNGVLLYERNSLLTGQGILSVQNFGLIGVFVLEPAEPVPPMTADDVEFERFQSMGVFAINEVLTSINNQKISPKLNTLVAELLKNYGSLERKINFVQGLRGRDDYIYKHVLNVAILCALISHHMPISPEAKNSLMTAAMVREVGLLKLPYNVRNGIGFDSDEKTEGMIDAAMLAGYDLIGRLFIDQPEIRRICLQVHYAKSDYKHGRPVRTEYDALVRILLTADMFDTMTAMKMEGDPASEIVALRTLSDHPQLFSKETVAALTNSIYFLAPGTTIEMNDREKGIVIKANHENVLEPIILFFDNNKVVDMKNRRQRGTLEIKDIMKTLDNRYVIDIETLRKNGFIVEEPEYLETPQ